MSYGAPIDQVIFNEPEVIVSPYAPELDELPRVKSASTKAMRISDAISKQLPRKANLSAERQTMAGGREEAAMLEAIGMRNAFAVTREQVRSSKNRAKAKNRAQQRLAERR